MIRKLIYILLLLTISVPAQNSGAFQIARVKYAGGGDWYNDPSAEINLLKYVSENTNIKVKPDYVFVDLNSNEIFKYPFLFFTGHGNIVFSDSDIRRLRTYLENGGFIYIDDDFGLDKAVRREFNKVFPNKNFIELPFSHPIYNNVYRFESGPPKTHEHNQKAPRGFGLFIGDRLVAYYTYESNPSDGWADPEVHRNPPAKREEALKFGTNIIVYALTN